MTLHGETGHAATSIAQVIAEIDLEHDDWIIDAAFDTVMTPPERPGDFDESAAWIEMN